MPEILEKLRPDRDLQCYFFRPSAIAALSGASPHGVTLSGTWRQQFDWAVIEWNRDSVFEHPMFRNLPDGDLSGLSLSYDETRSNCIPLDSDLFPTVDWPVLRIWADDGTGEKIYKVPIKQYAEPIEGSYQPASLDLTLSGFATTGDIVGLALATEHYPYIITPNTLDFAVKNIADGVNAFSPTMTAAQTGAKITLSYLGAGLNGRNTPAASTTGSNANRLGVYTYVGGSTEHWDAAWKQFSGGTSPTKWRVTLPFNSLVDPLLGAVPAHSIRKLRWTYAADLQRAAFERSEFSVQVSNWAVTGSGRTYLIAGPGSRRINDDNPDVAYMGTWSGSRGNFSGGTIHSTPHTNDKLRCRYSSAQAHALYLGTRLADGGPTIQILVDGQIQSNLNLAQPGEDVLVRHLIGRFEPGTHSVEVTHTGAPGSVLYFDFLEIAIPSTVLPSTLPEPTVTLATDWDTDHSIALAPERTAWIMDSLGFKGRVNHYVGALWFYELYRPGHQYASATVTFTGSIDPAGTTEIFIGRAGEDPHSRVAIQHINLLGDTPESVAKGFELQINSGYTAIWAEATGNTLTIHSRSMGVDGNSITIGVSGSTAHLTTAVSGPALSGGIDGDWRTDLTAVPRINRAVRDWTRSFCTALKSYGHTSVTTALSMEIQHGDPSASVGIGQMYPSQLPVIVNTPALQTNFSPVSTGFWKQAYADLAQIQVDAGLVPFIQFGEVQWWYFPDGDHSGMPFYDAYTTSTFKARYGRDMRLITENTIDPASVPEEAAFLPSLIGEFTNNIISFVRGLFPDCRFEVLYPPDVNDSALNKVINYPAADWTTDKLTCLKTESFSYTYSRNLDLSAQSVHYGASRGFPPSRRSHLVGIGDSSTAWLKESRMAQGKRFDSVVLFALDQFCLIGYPLPLSPGRRRSLQLG